MPPTLSRGRRIAVWTLIVLASLIGLATLLTTWVNRQMLSNESWTDASAELIENPKVRQALSVYLINELYANVDVAAELEQRLPPDLQPLASTVAGALRQPATEAVDRVLQAPRVQQLWIEANSLAQQKLVNVLEDKTGLGISTGNGVVTLDLSQLVSDLGVQLGLPDAVRDRLPPDAGVITVMSSDQLSAAQTAVKGVKKLSSWLLVLVLAMYGLAIYLARGARREAVRNIGWAFVVVGLLALIARRAVGNYAIAELTSPTSSDTGREVWLIGSSILGEIGWAVIIYGVVGALGAILAGPTRAATAVRRRIAPILNDEPGVAWAVVAFAFLLLVLWGPTHALRTVWGVALLAALLAAGIVALRRLTMRESLEPEPQRAAPAGEMGRQVA